MLLNHVTFTRRVGAMGLFGCLVLAFLPLGCTNSIEMAPVHYREQHPSDRHLLPSWRKMADGQFFTR